MIPATWFCQSCSEDVQYQGHSRSCCWHAQIPNERLPHCHQYSCSSQLRALMLTTCGECIPWLTDWPLPNKTIILRLYSRNIQHFTETRTSSTSALCLCALKHGSAPEKWDCGFQLRHGWWWLTRRSNTSIPSLCLCSFWALVLPGWVAGLSYGNFTPTMTMTSKEKPITPWCAISDPESPVATNTCSPPGQTRGTPASVDLAAWRCVLAPPCGPGVMMFPGRQGVGFWTGRRCGGTRGVRGERGRVEERGKGPP